MSLVLVGGKLEPLSRRILRLSKAESLELFGLVVDDNRRTVTEKNANYGFDSDPCIDD